jgi:AcrR family transcriptional regulator
MGSDERQSHGRHRGRERDSYHHGNLREALIEAALALIAERGPAGFTFAEVARAAGVSPAAPYRHFRDRNAVLAEIARIGFERFEARLRAAWREGRPDPVSAIEAIGQAYLAFARDEPASYVVMFASGLGLEDDPALLLASGRAFGVLREAADVACNRARGKTRPPPMMVALHLWSLAHGVASLFIGPHDGARWRLPMTAEDLLEAGFLIYLQALGLE